MATRQTFTGRTRNRKTRWTVYAGELLSRLFITVGGIGTILAVCTIGVFLVWVVYPLFLSASVSDAEKVPENRLPWKASDPPVFLAIDEDQIMGWALFADASVQSFRLDNGKALGQRRRLVEDQAVTAWSGPGKNDDWVFALADGTVRLATIDWATPFIAEKDLPEELRALPEGTVGEFRDGLLRRTPDGRFRALILNPELQDPVTLDSSPPQVIHRLDHLGTGESQTTICVVRDEPAPRLYRLNKELTVTVTPCGPCPVPPHPGKPDRILLAGTGDTFYLAWEDGTLCRYNVTTVDKPFLAETRRLIGDRTMTGADFLVGKTTLMVGDSSGRIRAWFATKPEVADTPDRVVLQAAHDFPGSGEAVTALDASTRTLMFAAGYADGRVRVFYATSEKLLADLDTGSEQPVFRVAIAPRNDGIVALTNLGLTHWRMKPGHPEATLRSLFLPVWYEDYRQPESVWQSSGGEPKLGLWPLIFGTLKATVYSLLIGVPLALLAAVYSSEFLHPRVKNVVKPTIELMASLPSVVLGFLAALVFAPVIDRVLPAFLCLFVTIPVSFLLGAYGWQLLPEKRGLRLARWRIVFIACAVPVGIAAAWVAGPVVERALFGGDVKHWLSGAPTRASGPPTFGSGTSGWLVLLLPFAALAVAFLMARLVNPWLRRSSATWDRTACAALDLVKFLLAAGATLLLAWLVGLLLNSARFDPRGPLPGTDRW